MSNCKESVCRLCLKIIVDSSFEVINDNIKDILDILLLKLNFDDNSNHVMCYACSRKLNAALEFKSTCLHTDNTIIPYVDCEDTVQLDLREIYEKENGNKQPLDMSDDQKICRLCMQLVGNEVRDIRKMEIDIIQNLVPEMNIYIIKDPVICKPCFDSLCVHNYFLKSCLEIDTKIRNTCDISNAKNPKSLLNLHIKNENLNIKSEIFVLEEVEISIKTETIDTKTDETEDESESSQHSFNGKIAENSDCKDTTTTKNILEVEHIWNQKNKSETCDVPVFTSNRKEKMSRQVNKNPQLKHEHASDVKTYKCNDCHYESKCRSVLISHQLKHKDSSQVQMYKCEMCDYESRYKSAVKRHQMVHRRVREEKVRTLQCYECDYVTNNKYHLASHVVIHKDPSQIQMYKCDMCDYESRYKNNHKRHLMVHKSVSEVQMYKCNECNYETKYKWRLITHLLKHKAPSQVQMYKCDVCNYQTRYKDYIEIHQIMHKSASDVQMYKCDTCGFKSKYKNYLKRHKLVHKSALEVQMYKCNECDYETKYKRKLVTHLLKHKAISSANVQM